MIKQNSRLIIFSRLLMENVLLLLLAGTQMSFTQKKEEEVLPAESESNASFVIDSLNYIEDKQHTLDGVYKVLNSLKKKENTVLTVVQLGDSHLQAGYLSGRIMRLLQTDFGNAGRGWVSPLKLAKTNEPDDYFIRSDNKEWINGRITHSSPKCAVGPGGIGILTKSAPVDFNVSIAPNNGVGYDFNRIILYRHPDARPLKPVVPDNNAIFVSGKKELAPGLAADTIRLHALTKELKLSEDILAEGKSDGDYTNLYYGFSLTNESPGVLYHSIGINGAMYVTYTSDSYMQQLAELKPALLIISLGTNESFGRNFREEAFEKQIDRCISTVRKYMPKTVILLTTPAECYRRIRKRRKSVYVRNENISKVARTIVRYAQNNGIACWDLFSATGGSGSCKSWYKTGLISRDRVHFTIDGYNTQGTLFYRALMHNYNIHISKNVSN